jgi:beta-glucosidase
MKASNGRSRPKVALCLAIALLATGPAAAQTWPRAALPQASDPALEARVRAIVAGMTLEQKVGQMTQPDIRSVTPDEVRRYYIGSVLNGGGAWPAMNMHASVDDWLKLSDAFYRASMSTDMKVKVPVIWGTDAVHGHNNVYGATLFPHNIGLGAAHDPALVERIGHATAEQVRAPGITWAFAPTLAVVQNPRWGRTYESYSSNPDLVRSYGEAMVRGLQGKLGSPTSVLATAKHYLGDGGTFHGKDQGETRTTEANLARTHAAGYYGALKANVRTVMVSYSSFTDTATGKRWGKMHGNAHLVGDVLKKRMGFDGLVVSDWNGIEQVPGCTKWHCPQAINAGIDLAMVPDDWKKFIPATIADVRAGRIKMSRIDDAVSRIIRVKLE